jgi:L1 cell adhesion molecule like protein
MSSQENTNGYAIGIDLGTTYCCNATYRNGKVEIIPSNTGDRTTPSFISFSDSEIFIGLPAKNILASNPLNTVYDIKRIMGKSFDNKVLQSDLKYFSFKINNDTKTNRPLIYVSHMNEEKKYFPEQLSSLLLAQLKKDAEDYLGGPVTKAVITVPAYFNNAQRQATKDAGEIAGLDVLRIINEPTAASIAYGINICENEKMTSRNVVVFDLGGGTLDVSVLTIVDGVFEVKSTNGDIHLGGIDFDNKLLQYCIAEFVKINSLTESQVTQLLKDIRAQRRLKSSCETAKRTLSTSLTSTIYIDSFFTYNDCNNENTISKDLNITISRSKFEELCQENFKRCIIPLEQALKDSKLSKSEIDEVIMIGGSTRIPYVREIVQKFFNGKQLRVDVNPDEAVATGAAIQAAILNGQMDITLDGLVLVDVTPLSLGIEARNNEMSIIIERNTTIPCACTKIYSTNTDNQRSVKIKVFEGERPLTKDNTLLGTFELVELPPMPRGVPRIKVTFEIDVNGILHVVATEETTGKSKKISIKRDNNKFNEDDITKMIEMANKCKTIDSMIKATLSARNELEKYLYGAKHTIDMINLYVCTTDILRAKALLTQTQEWFDKNISANAIAIKEKHSNIESELTPLICQLLSTHSDTISKNQQEQPKEPTDEHTEEQPKEPTDEHTEEQPKEPVSEQPKESISEQPKESISEQPKEPINVNTPTARHVGRPRKIPLVGTPIKKEEPKKRGRKPKLV